MDMRTNFDRLPSRPTQPGPPPLLIGAILLLLLAALFLGLDRWHRRHATAETATPEEPGLQAGQPVEMAGPALRGMSLPSPQQNLFEPGWQRGVQPTVSGKPESGLYGSSRTGNSGLASFHEGVDIAVVSRDARGNPTDPAVAVGDGQVAYVNRSIGDSNYGLYVVLFHPDPAGVIYSLYAHLAAIEPALAPGVNVARGARLGTVGHTPSAIIPLDRAHLHFEIGLLASDRFPQWAKLAGMKDPHGNFNGRNLLGVDPLGVIAESQRNPDFSMLAYLQALPPAFSVIARSRGRMPDYFRRHPALWNGAADGRAFVITCSEGGVPLSGRVASDEETARLGRASGAVLAVNEAVLGRNGRHLVVKRADGWQLGQNGESWLDVLMF